MRDSLRLSFAASWLVKCIIHRSTVSRCCLVANLRKCPTSAAVRLTCHACTPQAAPARLIHYSLPTHFSCSFSSFTHPFTPALRLAVRSSHQRRCFSLISRHQGTTWSQQAGRWRCSSSARTSPPAFQKTSLLRQLSISFVASNLALRRI